jgi:hypothetical protein
MSGAAKIDALTKVLAMTSVNFRSDFMIMPSECQVNKIAGEKRHRMYVTSDAFAIALAITWREPDQLARRA